MYYIYVYMNMTIYVMIYIYIYIYIYHVMNVKKLCVYVATMTNTIKN